MTTHSPDVTYAYARLGLAFGASPEEIGAVLDYARSYAFWTHARVREVERFVEFFTARDKLGDISTPFPQIRRAYLRKAMMLHPDRNDGNRTAEEQLKIIIAAFTTVEAIHREARDYYRQNEEVRKEIEDDARATTLRERPPEKKAKRKPDGEHAKKKQAEPQFAEEKPEPVNERDAPRRPGIKYVAASIPRFVRTARLSHIPTNCVIGCWHIVQRDGSFFIYDIIMLPEREFLRARMHLATPIISTPALQRGSLTPTFIPKDIKAVTVPAGELYPERYARDYFLKEFGMEGKG